LKSILAFSQENLDSGREWIESVVSREEAALKKVLLIAAAVMLIASGSNAQVLPPVGYIGIFKDATHSTYYNPICPDLYAQFHAWIWCLPDVNGLQAAEFAVSFPATAVEQFHVKNPGIAVEFGSLTTGSSVAFAEGLCQRDWVWLYDITMVLLARSYSRIEIIPHPGTLPIPTYQFATCQLGYPIVPCRYLTPLHICPTWDVEETSWGAIKGLF